MKCVIPGINIKVFGRAIHSLGKLGEELYVEPSPTGVAFRTVNSARSAFASYTFGSSFFSHYDDGLAGTEKNSGDEPVKCKVAMKACLNVFKSLTTLERSVERCKITLDPEESKLGIQLTCRYSITKTYNLSFIECEQLQAVYDKDSCPNLIRSPSRVLSDAVHHFQSSQDEVTLCISPQKTIIRNYVDDEPDPAKAIHTVLTLEAGEFDSYNISNECEVTFCLKELRALLGFAEPVNLPIASHFSDPGSPIIFMVDNKPMFEGVFVLATLADKSNSQMSRQSKAKQNTQTPSRSSTTAKNTSGESTYLRGDNACSRKSEQISNMSSLYEKRGSISSAHNSSTLLQQEARKSTALMSPVHHTGPITSTSNGNAPQLELSAVNHSLPDINNSVVVPEPDLEDSDVIPGTPPAKRLKSFLFRRCFEATFNPDDMPGFKNVLAPDSDSED